MITHKAFILLGSNLGNRLSQLEEACRAIENAGITIIERSSVYETEPWGNNEQPAFLNMMLQIATTLAPDALMQRLLDIEHQMGRKRIQKYGPRTIDIDILFFDDLVYQSTLVSIPHPHIQERRFVLEPMCELAASKKHPVLNKTMYELLMSCEDPLAVKRLSIS